MRYFALYHDRTRLHDVDVMNEEQVMGLALFYGINVNKESTKDEKLNDSLDYLLKMEACVRIEELTGDKNDKRKSDEYYLKDKEEVL